MTTLHSPPPVGPRLRQLLQAGDAHRRHGDVELAIDAYAEVADAYRDSGRATKALVVLRHIWGIVRMHTLQHHVVRFAMQLGELAGALDHKGEALAAYDAAANALRAEGRIHEALDTYGAMRDLEPGNPLVNLRLAECHADLGDIGGAVPLLGYAAVRMRAHGRLDEALLVLDRLLVLRCDPRYARLAAEVHLQRGSERDAVEAVRKLKSAYEANREDLGVLELLARAFDAVGQPQRAATVRAEAARIAVARDGSQETVRQSALDHAAEIEGEITDLLMRQSAAVKIDEDALWRVDELAYEGRYAEARAILIALVATAPDHFLVRELDERVTRLAARQDEQLDVPEICPVPPSSVRPTGIRSVRRFLELKDAREETPPHTERAWPPSSPEIRESASVPGVRVAPPLRRTMQSSVA